jgi:hypothetical protein
MVVTTVGPPTPVARYSTALAIGCRGAAPSPSASESKCSWWPEGCGREWAHSSTWVARSREGPTPVRIVERRVETRRERKVGAGEGERGSAYEKYL